MAKHPMQPIQTDESGISRFKRNPIVRALLDNGPWDLNRIWAFGYSEEDMRQFYQLIGYSVSGYEDVFGVELEDSCTSSRVRREKLCPECKLNYCEYPDDEMCAWCSEEHGGVND